jgi:ribonuclease P protein component
MTAGPDSSTTLRRLSKRAQFLNVARGKRAGRTAFSLQSIVVDAPDAGLGLTVTKKTGNSPERNRIKRRLRAAARACGNAFRPQHDYVLVGRREALSLPFTKVVADLNSALRKLHDQTTPDPGSSRP